MYQAFTWGVNHIVAGTGMGESMALWCSQWEARHIFFFRTGSGTPTGSRVDRVEYNFGMFWYIFLCYNRGCTRTNFCPSKVTKTSRENVNVVGGRVCKIHVRFVVIWVSFEAFGTVPDLTSVRFPMVSSLFFCIIENDFIDPSEAEKNIVSA